ncbi:hypothetical protein [Lyngbya aestuarii]|uniref:hypothetical protein n=1 Tax=Lyngbya aestuarii TaxID=118322 RepID=UPI00403DF4FB
MNSSVNRFSDSPASSGVQPPEASSIQSQHPPTPIGDSEMTTNSDAQADSTGTTPVDTQRQQPIPPPSEPLQYRAIGLIRGKYMPSAEQLTRGTLLAADGTLIDAVLLGRVMSLVKNHLSLEQDHLWVVYPRTRQTDDHLHVQIVGVWEPEKLNKAELTEEPESEEPESEEPESEEILAESQAETSPDSAEAESTLEVTDGYFSIRGEVIYQSHEEQQVVVKIQQSARKDSDKPKFFRLKLKGTLEKKLVRHFCDFHVLLQANALQIQEANDIRAMPSNKGRGRNNRKRPPMKKNGFKQRPMRKGERPTTAQATKRREAVPKPIKRSEQNGGGGNSGNSS